jgi:hypothetical protein
MMTAQQTSLLSEDIASFRKIVAGAKTLKLIMQTRHQHQIHWRKTPMLKSWLLLLFKLIQHQISS